MSQSFSNGGTDENGDVYPASFDCDDCGLSLSWPVTPGVPASQDPVAMPMLAMIADHDRGGCTGGRERRRLDLLAEVRRRDGDQCRFCHQIVDVKDRKAGNSMAFFLTWPSRPAVVEETFVVCRSCLGASNHTTLEIAAEPKQPVYSQATLDWFAKNVRPANEPSGIGVDDQLGMNIKGGEEFSHPGRITSADLVIGKEAPGLSAGRKPVLLKVLIDSVNGSDGNRQEETLALRITISHGIQESGQILSMEFHADAAICENKFQAGHQVSLSVGAPKGAACDNSQHTEEGPTQRSGAAGPILNNPLHETQQSPWFTATQAPKAHQ